MQNIITDLGIHYEPNTITTIGLLIAVTFLGSKIFQRLGIPQVVGFIVMGVLLGTSFFNIVPLDLVEELTFVSQIALGLIGFDMGSHLRFNDVRQKGRSILFILLFESFGTFVLVTAGIYAITRSLHTALIFGALSSATAPAATVDVLAEYDAKMAELDKESEALLAEYVKQGEDAKARILKEAEAAAERLKEQASKNIEHEFLQAKTELKAIIVEKALAKAEAIIKEKINSDDQEKLVDEYLEKVVA